MPQTPFDTLKYARILKKNGIEKSEIHAMSLSQAITKNIYLKSEVDKMIDAALKRSDQALADFRINMIKDRAEHQRRMERSRFEYDQKMIKIQHEMDKKIDEAFDKGIHKLTVNIGIIVSILTVVSLLLHYIH